MPAKPRPLPGSWVDAWRVTPTSELPSGVRCVLFALSNYMDRRGVCWPSHSSLARDTGMTPRHVRRLLAYAEAAGWIEREQGAGAPGNGGRTTLYRSRISEGRDTHVPTPEGRDIHDAGRDTHVPEVGTPMSPECPIERPVRTSRTKLCDGTHRTSLHDWQELLDRQDAKALARAPLDSLDLDEAGWILAGLAAAEREGVEADGSTATDLAATALYDLGRKAPHRWSRRRFVGFLTSAARLRTDKSGDGTEGDTDVIDALERAWASA